MWSLLIQKYNWAFFKPLLIETYLYLLVGAAVFAIILYLAKKVLKVKIKWGIAFIVLLLLAQYCWYKQGSTMNILTGKTPLSTQIGTIDSQTRQIKGDGQHGFLAYGPYMPLAKGVYQTVFEIKSDNTATQSQGYCDINVLGLEQNNVRAEITSAGFKQGKAQKIALTVVIPEGNPKVEFRVFQYGGNNLNLTRLHLMPAGIKEVILKNKDRFLQTTVYIFGALLFIGIFLKLLIKYAVCRIRKLFVFSTLLSIIAGIIIAYIWQVRGISAQHAYQTYYDMWRVFYAPAWLPLTFIFFNFLYVLNFSFGFSRQGEKYLKYDLYTLAIFPIFMVFELLAHNFHTHMVLGNLYLIPLVIKSIIYFSFLWQNLKEQEDILSSKPVKWTIFLSIFTVYLLIAPWVNAAFYTDGDETVYLLKTQSIIKDHDMDILNNSKNGDVLSYHPDVSWTLWFGTYTTAGYSFAMVPGFLIGGRFGATVTMGLVGSLVAMYVFLLILLITRSIAASYLGMLTPVFACPLGIYATILYPELVAGLIAIYCLRKLLLPWNKFFLNIVSVVFLSSILLFFKERYIALTVMMLLALAYKLRKNIRMLIPLIIIIGLGCGIYLLFDKFTWNQDGAKRILSGLKIVFNLKPLIGKEANGILGLLLDQECGLLIYAPIFLFSIIGIISLGTSKKSFKTALLLIAIIIPYVLTIAQSASWSSGGGGALSPRYIVAIVPILAVGIGIFFSALRQFWLKIITVLAVLWSSIMYYALLIMPQYRTHSPNAITGRNEILDRLYASRLLPNLTIIFPSLLKPGNYNDLLIVIYSAVFVLLLSAYIIQRIAPNEILNKDVWRQKKLILMVLGILLAGILVFCGHYYRNYQEFGAGDMYLGGAYRQEDLTQDAVALNGNGFFALTKVALRKGEKVYIVLSLKGTPSEPPSELSIETGTDLAHTRLAKLKISSNNWSEYSVPLVSSQAGLLPFWFVHTNFTGNNLIYLKKIVFSAPDRTR